MYLVMMSVLKWRHCVCQTSRCILLPKSHLTKIQSTHYSYKTRKTTLFLFYNDQWRQKQIEGGRGARFILKNLDKQKQENPLAWAGTRVKQTLLHTTTIIHGDRTWVEARWKASVLSTVPLGHPVKLHYIIYDGTKE